MSAEGRNGKEGSARGRTSGDTDERRVRIGATPTAPGATRSFRFTESAVHVDAPGYAQLASVALAVGHLLHPRKARHGASRCESRSRRRASATSLGGFSHRRLGAGSRRLGNVHSGRSSWRGSCVRRGGRSGARLAPARGGDEVSKCIRVLQVPPGLHQITAQREREILGTQGP